MVDARANDLSIRTIPLPHGFSFFLNTSRFGAALLVFVMHALMPGPVLSVIGPFRLEHDAVLVFFVLSGYLVAYAAENREPTLVQFAASRAARILSVSVPALVLTALYETMGRLIWPGWITGPLSHLAPWLAGSIFFLNEAWYLDLRIPSETPYWSLAYEVWFYAIFAAWFFGRGAKRAFGVGAASLVAGPKVLLLMPVWLLGVAVFHIHKRKHHSSFIYTAIFVFTLVVYVIWKLFAGREPYFDTIGWFGSTFSGKIWYYSGLDLDPSSLPFHDLVVGLIFSALLWSSKFISFPVSRRGPVFAIAKWGAGISFSLYLYQIPIFNIIIRMYSFQVNFPLFVSIMLITTFVIVIALAAVTEHRKDVAERWIYAAARGLVQKIPRMFSTSRM